MKSRADKSNPIQKSNPPSQAADDAGLRKKADTRRLAISLPLTINPSVHTTVLSFTASPYGIRQKENTLLPSVPLST